MKPGGFGRDDIYITFRGKNGQWGPYVTRDGKYFFFTSTRNGSRDTFWVRAEYIDRFRN